MMNKELFAMFAVGQAVMKQVEHILNAFDAAKTDDDLCELMNTVSPNFDGSGLAIGLAHYINQWVLNDEEMARALVGAVDEIKSEPLFAEVEEAQASDEPEEAGQ